MASPGNGDLDLELAPARRRSYSQLSEFAECGHKFWLKRIKKYPERPALWGPGGTAFHSTCDNIDRGECIDDIDIKAAWELNFSGQLEELQQEEPDPKNWRTAGRKTKDKPNGEDVEWWAVEGARMALAYAEWRESSKERLRLWELPNGDPAIEVGITVEIGGASVVQFVDRIFQDVQTDALLIVDLKTGSREPSSTLQLGTYKIGIERAFREQVEWGAYYMARTGKLSNPPKDLRMWTQEMLDEVYRKMDTAARLDLFIPNIGMHCGYCGVREFCIFKGGKEPE